MTAAELAKGRALRDAEQGLPYQRRTTYAFSDWLDRHCDELLDAAARVAEQDARIVQLEREIELLCKGIRLMTCETPAPPPEHLSGVNDDYYMPGHKNEIKGE